MSVFASGPSYGQKSSDMKIPVVVTAGVGKEEDVELFVMLSVSLPPPIDGPIVVTFSDGFVARRSFPPAMAETIREVAVAVNDFSETST